MMTKHIAFFLTEAYGHIIPTLGFASELLRRGHRVSYAVTAEFAPAILRFGAHPAVFKPLEWRRRACEYTARADGSHDFNSEDVQLRRLASELMTQRSADALPQLDELFRNDTPDLLVYDDSLSLASCELAKKWRIPKVRHCPAMGMVANQPERPDEERVLVSVPQFFDVDAPLADERVKFIGFSPEGRRGFFEPWQYDDSEQKVILACPTTGLLPQVHFCRLIVQAFRESKWNVILSVSGDLDPISAIDTELLSDLPNNIKLNRHSSNLNVLEHAYLFIGQGGQGSTLEAMFCGVPSLLVPAAQFQDAVARRVVELGLGARLPISEATPQDVRSIAESLIADRITLTRVKLAQEAMHAEDSAVLGANLVEEWLKSSACAGAATMQHAV